MAAFEKGDPQFLLQVNQLTGKGGLGQPQDLSGRGDAPLLGDGQKVFQNPKFHKPPCLLSQFSEEYHPYYIQVSNMPTPENME